MPNAVLLVTTQPSAPEREAEFNDWYSNVHLAEVCAVDGVVGASRFQQLDTEPPTYLAVYAIEHDDPQSVVHAIGVAAMSGKMRMSDSLSMSPPPKMELFVQG